MSDPFTQTEPRYEGVGGAYPPQDTPSPTFYTPYNPEQSQTIALSPSRNLTDSINTAVSNFRNSKAVALVLTTLGSVFLLVGLAFIAVAIFVTGWTGTVNGVPASPEQATFVGKLVFGVLGGVFTLVGAFFDVIGIRKWLRQKDLR